MNDDSDLLRAYLARMLEIRGTGGAVAETSYYSALEGLLNAIGERLKPNVICNGQIANQGAGHPDFGLYTRDQVRRGEDEKGQTPERGVIEVKGLAEATEVTAATTQSNKYLDRYGLLLITNYRDFRLIRRAAGVDMELERYVLADDADSFWSLALKPQKAAAEHATHLIEALQRMLMANAPLSRAEDVAWFLASYARDALATLEDAPSAGLDPLRKALEGALGMRFEGEKGEHFFRSTLIQTLFYGVFSAWISHARESKTPFDWRLAAHGLTVPMVRTLFEEIAKPSRLGALGLGVYLDRAQQTLNRIERAAFLAGLDADQAIQHFYEPFLAAFDPELRKQLGVWYTPPEIVRYMVERVDRLLRTDLNKPDGLADPSVYVLDPCCGTGAYVVAVLDRIHRTLEARGADAAEMEQLKRAAMERVFGFEIMPAPFVIAHWRVGAFLSDETRKLALSPEANERAAIYLTNALTGWEPAETPKDALPFPEMEAEADAADEIKQDRPLLVILGNPPYNAYAGVSPAEEGGLVNVYKQGLRDKWGIKKWNLDDPYIRFFRVAQRRLGQSPQGILCFISNASYVDDGSFAVMREHLLSAFDSIWIDNLNGDSRETGKRTPEGLPDPSIFSTDLNREGIQVGTAIGTFLRISESEVLASVAYRDFWGRTKRNDLLSSLDTKEPAYVSVTPEGYSKLSFKPHVRSQTYASWPDLRDLAAAEPVNGLMEKRGGALIDADPEALKARMAIWLDPTVEFADLERTGHRLARKMARYEPKRARARLLEEGYDAARVKPYDVRAFEVLSAYITETRPTWNEPRPELQRHAAVVGNSFVLSRSARVSDPEGVPFLFASRLFDNDAQRGHSYGFPRIAVEDGGQLLGQSERPNVSGAADLWFDTLTPPPPDRAKALWRHVLAVGYSPAYLSDNDTGLKKGWPRVPLPANGTRLTLSERLGERLEVLLDPRTPAPGVTSGAVSSLHRRVASLSKGSYRVTANWGARTRDGKVMPGRGDVIERDWTDEELAAIAAEAAERDLDLDQMLALLGGAVDVHLNGEAQWRAIPVAVWEYHIGGYQVLKKWLSYREYAVLGRDITPAEATHFRDTARRLTEIVMMGPALDENYADCAAHSYTWPR